MLGNLYQVAELDIHEHVKVQKFPGSNLARYLTKLRDKTSLQGSR